MDFDFSWFCCSQSMKMTWPVFLRLVKMGRLMKRKKMGQAIVARTKIAPELRWPTFSAWERRSLLLTDRAITFGVDFAICITIWMEIKEFIVFPRRGHDLRLALFFPEPSPRSAFRFVRDALVLHRPTFRAHEAGPISCFYICSHRSVFFVSRRSPGVRQGSARGLFQPHVQSW